LIKSKAAIAVQSSQMPAPCRARQGRAKGLQGVVSMRPRTASAPASKEARFSAIQFGATWLSASVGQDHAVAFARFHKPRLGKVHHRATGGAGVCGGRRQSIFDDADVERQTCAELSGEARTAIGAIVGEHDNANERRRNRIPQPVALAGKSTQAGRQALFFIPDGYGDDETWSSGRGRDKH
jgi:hypothetical protein